MVKKLLLGTVLLFLLSLIPSFAEAVTPSLCPNCPNTPHLTPTPALILKLRPPEFSFITEDPVMQEAIKGVEF